MGGVRESRFVTVTRQKTRDSHGSQCMQCECKSHFHLFMLCGIDHHMFKQTWTSTLFRANHAKNTCDSHSDFHSVTVTHCIVVTVTLQ